MKKHTIGLILLLPWLVTFGSEPAKHDITLDEIIKRHIEAYGGREKWDAVEALDVRGHFTGFSQRNDFYTLKTAGGKFFSTFNLGQHRLQEGHDGTTYWTIDPWQGFDYPRKINRAERHVFMQKSELFSPFYRWKERGFQVELKGTEEVDGLEMYVLSLTRPGMPEETWYLDTQTYLAYKSITPWADFAYPMVAETYYDDYREVNGLLLPHYMEQTFSTRHTVTEIEEVIVNPEYDSGIFRMPACPQMEKLTALSGDWNVQVEMMTRTGNFHTFDQMTGSFEKTTGDVMQGSISYEVNFPVTTRYTLNYNRHTGRYQLVVYNELHSTTHLFNGNWVDGSLVFDNLPEEGQNEASASAGQQPLTQYVFTVKDEKTFLLERNRSVNNGETWLPVKKLTYTQ
jgi:hypothetical protein